MVGAGSRSQSISATLSSAYGDGLLSDRTFADRMELLLGGGLVEPERLIGDLSLRRTRGSAGAAVARLRERWRRRRAGRATAPLLALDWSGATEELIVGRMPGCDVVLPHPTVSRVHARLRHSDSGWVIVDLGSTNGTAVNRVPVVRCQLAPGDRLRLGEMTLVID